MTLYTQTEKSAAQSALRFYTGTAHQGTSQTTAAAWGTAPPFPRAVCCLGLQIQTKEEQAPEIQLKLPELLWGVIKTGNGNDLTLCQQNNPLFALNTQQLRTYLSAQKRVGPH